MNPNKNHIRIVADDRERESGVIEALRGIEGVDVEVRRLAYGDYHAGKRLVFERKTLNDFAISIVDGRLFKQLIRISNSSLRAVMILEGRMGLLSGNMKREAIQGALVSITLIMGIPVLCTKDAFETAKSMVYATRQISSVTNGSVKRYGYYPKTKTKRQNFILQGLPGIGPEKATRLLKAFGTVEGVIGANIEELQAVGGIGKNIAERIKWTVS